MGKKYQDMKEEPLMAAEPLVAYGVDINHQLSDEDLSFREKIMAETVSVDEYFDELLAPIIAKKNRVKAHDISVEDLYHVIEQDIEAIYAE